MKRVVIVLLILFTFYGINAQQTETLGIALSGGGARGMAHVGVLKVLEEYGIKPDYITGTSMGAIIGGLYSVGYDAKEIEKILEMIDWENLLMDKIERNDLPKYEKDDLEKNILELEIKDHAIVFPLGLLTGQKLTVVLVTLLSQDRNLKSFDDLEIPFRCIATDLQTGEAIVFSDGYLPDAVRASMSIPSVFAPVSLNGRTLIDGGIVRNFPVSDVREMGADYVLGIDVASGRQTGENLKSALSIINQTISLTGFKSTEEQRKLCDIYIKPDLEEFTLLGFNDTTEIINRGEVAARSYFENNPEELAKLIALSKGKEIAGTKHLEEILTRKMQIVKIRFQGLDKVSRNMVRNRLKLNENTEITMNDLRAAMARLYGSKYFESVSYRLFELTEGYELVFIFKESTLPRIGIGIHFDTETDASLLLNTTIMNPLIEGSKLIIDTKLSTNPEVKLRYFVHTGWKPGLGISSTLYYGNREFDVYYSNDVSSNIKFWNSYARLALETNFSNNVLISAGLMSNHLQIKDESAIDEIIEVAEKENQHNCVFINLNIDTYSRKNFCKRGISVDCEYREYYYSSIEDETRTTQKDIQTLMIRSKAAHQLSERLSLNAKLVMGFSDGSLAQDQFYFAGGFDNYYFDNFIEFPGFKLGRYASGNVISNQYGFQYELADNLFFESSYHYLLLATSYSDFVSEDFNYYDSYNFNLGYILPLGPIILKSSYNPDEEKFNVYFSIGYDW